ncbi:MAG: NADPH-dependent 7-cyano-7-deazaguanine reductase QueF [Pseudohongiellaceae bacterium]
MADNPLGKNIALPHAYAPQVLTAIPRQDKRSHLGLDSTRLPFHGADIWNAYELSWLNHKGKPQVAMARFIFPCESPNLVESKSLKLYLGSLHQEQAAGIAEIENIIARDLSEKAGAAVQVRVRSLTGMQHFLPATPAGECLDGLDLETAAYTVDPGLLRADRGSATVAETLYTDLFRSNCPITQQPDWASVTIRYKGHQLAREGLLKYLVSYRQHNDYHENCIERIYCDIQQRCQPQQLVVEANFLRRGGLDINPVRSSSPLSELQTYPRYLRQ